MTEPDDRELERYLEGGSPVSRRYREASAEAAPPELDEAVLAKARAELRRRPAGINRWLAPIALAASVMLGINLGWNVYHAQPMPRVPMPLQKAQERDDAFVPEPPVAARPQARDELRQSADAHAEARKERAAPAPEAAAPPAVAGGAGTAPTDADQRRQAEDLAAVQSKRSLEDRAAMAARQDAELERRETMSRAQEPVAAPAAPPAPMTEREKIERLLMYVGQLDDVDFIRNGKEYPAAEAAKHLRLKLDKAGDRVKTADDFIRLCASHSYVSGEAYLIRFPDGRTRTAEDVLREQLATMP
jgi:hypothetical protein